MTDQGIGMDEQKLALIQSRQFKRSIQDNGFGLGLSFTHRFIDQLKGTLHIQSKIGEGTSFTVRLPLDQAPVSRSEIKI